MTQTVDLFVFNGFSDWEPAYAIAALNGPSFQRQPGRFRVRTVARTKDTVVSMGGLHIQPEAGLEALDPSHSALLILPGGTAWEEGKNMEAIDAARAYLDAGVPVAAICAATYGLARGGLLDDRRHTSNAKDYLAPTGYAGAHLYDVAPAVTDGDLITASGIAPVDFAYQIFRQLEAYSPAVLEAWYRLFKTGQPEHFASLVQAWQDDQPGGGT